MRIEAPRNPAIRAATPAWELLVSGLLVSMITAGTLVRLRLGSLDGPLASLAGALAGAVFLPVAGGQLAARRLWPTPKRLSPLVLHAVLVPWATGLVIASGIVVGTSLALARVTPDNLPGACCASFADLLAARWALDKSEGAALVAALQDGSSVRFELAEGNPACQRLRR